MRGIGVIGLVAVYRHAHDRRRCLCKEAGGDLGAARRAGLSEHVVFGSGCQAVGVSVRPRRAQARQKWFGCS
jgi:hypothetical protein